MQLVVLDVNGTLFSMDPIARRLSDVGLDGQLDVWFARILRDGFAAAAAGGFAAFADLARHHLHVLLEAQGAEAPDETFEHVLGGFEQVVAHPDVEPGLQRLADAGVAVATMTNGTVDITRRFLDRAGLAPLVAATHDVAMAGQWKPAPRAYRFVLDHHDVEPQHAVMIAVHPWDIQGASAAGMTPAWINRDSALYPDPFTTPDVLGRSLVEVVDSLLAQGA